jgi:tRNA/rRNA methyltransferase
MNFYVIIVENDSPENTGAIARVMGNFSQDKLVLVKPLWKDVRKALLIAHTSAGKIVLRKRRIFGTFEDAIKELELNIVIGFTRRAGKNREISHNYRDYFEGLYSGKIKKKVNIGLVFGREETGMTDSEIEKCSILVHIPSSISEPSLNLSHAVGIILNEIFFHSTDKYKKANAGIYYNIDEVFGVTTSAERDLFYREIKKAAEKKKLFIQNDERTFRRLFERIFISPVITKKDLELFKRLLMRFLFAEKRDK